MLNKSVLAKFMRWSIPKTMLVMNGSQNVGLGKSKSLLEYKILKKRPQVRKVMSL